MVTGAGFDAEPWMAREQDTPVGGCAHGLALVESRCAANRTARRFVRTCANATLVAATRAGISVLAPAAWTHPSLAAALAAREHVVARLDVLETRAALERLHVHVKLAPDPRQVVLFATLGVGARYI